MDEQHNGFDHSAEGPEVDDSANPTESSPDQNEKPRAPAGREMLIQLQQMIDNVSYQAAPVVREVAAKAAELAAVAGSKAGPLAYKAAEATDQFGQKVAERSKSMAADLRRMRGDDSQPPESPSGEAGPADAGSPDSDQGDAGGSAPGL